MPNSKGKSVQLIVKPPISEMRKNYRAKINSLKNLATVYTKVSIFLDRWVQSNFKTEGGKVGDWKPIARDGMILQDTGRLRASFLPFATKKNAGIGSDLPYSKKHEEGQGVTKRRMLPKEKEVKKGIKKIFDLYIKKVLKK